MIGLNKLRKRIHKHLSLFKSKDYSYIQNPFEHLTYSFLKILHRVLNMSLKLLCSQACKFVKTFECFKGTLSSLRQFLETECPLKMMKNTFYFTLKALLVLKIKLLK